MLFCRHEAWVRVVAMVAAVSSFKVKTLHQVPINPLRETNQTAWKWSGVINAVK